MPTVTGLLLKAEGLSDDLPDRSVLRNGPPALAAGCNHRRAKTWPLASGWG